ncbi:MAG: hypothetical protein EOP48_15620 [Sphingobacteriales bacterium]|nr:MAG: hypothetical protein EOP48_15620 [Sphingobacteriales bacterium]
MQVVNRKSCASPGNNLSSAKPKSLEADQLLFEAIDLMLKSDTYNVPVYNRDVKIADLKFSDITGFLSENSEMNLLFHKLNYTVSTFLELRTGLQSV